MPYVVHPLGADLSTSEPLSDCDCRDCFANNRGIVARALFLSFADRPSAVTYLRTLDGTDPKHVITFQCSVRERDAWHTRERGRFRDGTYGHTPWSGEDFAYVLGDHFAHLSLSHAGLVAYTPSDEYGMADRQLRCTPAKYLAQHAPQLSSYDVARYVASVKAFDTSALHFAVTEDEIARVYHGGPPSCMDGRHADCYMPQTGDIHPTIVYAGHGLEVAYLGTLDKASARCVVWRKVDALIHTRCYGDSTLQCLLRAAGWTHGNLYGAKIQARRLPNGAYVMPYIDAADGATLDRGRKTFTLTDDSSDYPVKSQSGTTRETDTRECQHCGTDYEYTDDSHSEYCDECASNRQTCGECSEAYFDADGAVINGDWYCDECAGERASTCARGECGDTFYDDTFSTSTRRERARRHVSNLCRDCASRYDGCGTCADVYFERGTTCPDCVADETETAIEVRS